MNIAQKALKKNNNFLRTVVSGAKGDYFNIAQITGLLGQQNLNGQRICPQLSNNTRTLPHYPIKVEDYTDDMRYESRGFIKSSFTKGLSPREFYFHTMTGREGITDTAMKTATSGYIQRRMIKLAEDIQIKYDNTVRNSSGGIIQFIYGDNNMDPVHTVFNKSENGIACNVERLVQRLNNRAEDRLNASVS
jgi:DNA-directed RNA polymerase II subunit RPB1